MSLASFSLINDGSKSQVVNGNGIMGRGDLVESEKERYFETVFKLLPVTCANVCHCL